MSRMKHARIGWLVLLVVAALLVVIPTALAQGPDTTSPQEAYPGPTSPQVYVPGGEGGPNQDGGTLELGVETRHYSGGSYLPNAISNGWGVWNALNDWNRRWYYTEYSSWEEDFKRNSYGGFNQQYVDDVDLVFYEGHGWPGGFTFYPGHDDGDLTSADAYRTWGDRDVEWIALLSCSVLADSNRVAWANTMAGLHLLMGFKTTAYDVAGFGSWFGDQIHGWYFMGMWFRSPANMTSAWFSACDNRQPTGVWARVLAEEPNHFGDTMYYQYPDWWDYDYYWWDHACGSEYARPASAIQGQMPVFMTPALSLAESAAEWNSLTTAFGLPAASTGIMSTSPMSGTEANGRELTMDPASGLFYYVDHNLLYTPTQALLMGTQSTIMANDAYTIANTFLTNNGLLPADAQFYEVAANSISQGVPASRATGVQGAAGPEQVTVIGTTDYSVIYSRILTYTVMGANGVQTVQEYSVGGPGAKMKVYVNPAGALTSAAANSPAAQGVVGAQGGWRVVDNQTALAGKQPLAVALTPVLDFSPSIELLFQNLESQVALAQVPFDNPTSKSVVTYTLMYWEEPSGSGQDQLFPAYDLTAQYVGLQGSETVTVTDHTYIPAAAEFMRPYAKIVSSNAGSGNFVAGEVLQASAANAALPLSSHGFTGLDFVLGSGVVNYNWYLTGPDGLVFIGTGMNLNWTVDPDKITVGKAVPAPQSLVLQVTDLSTAHTSQQMSQDALQFNVVPPVFLPLVVRF